MASPEIALVKDALALHPKTVAELLNVCRSKNPDLSEQQLLSAVKVFNEEGKLVLSPRRFQSFGEFLVSPCWNTNLLAVLVVCAASGLLYFVAGSFPWSLLQIVPGILLVFYLPGRSLLRILLGQRVGQALERIVLEIATSIVMIMLLGLLLNFSGLGLFSTPALASVVILNVLVALWASYEEFSITWLKV